MLSGTPHSKSSSHLRSSTRGFTLIELLMVIAIIGLLSAATFGISKGVQNAKKRAVAKAELVVISQALEQYKSQHGDYPWSSGDPSDLDDNAEVLFKALVGWMEFSNSSGTVVFQVKTGVSASSPDSYVDIAKLTYRDLNDSDESQYNPEVDLSSAPSNHVFLDPWGQPYVYLYGKVASSNTWEVFGYHLFSMGADSVQEESAINSNTGVMVDDFREVGSGGNIDNIYSGE